MLSSEQIKKILTSEKILPQKELENLEKEAKKNKKSLGSYLIEKKIITSNSLYENASKYFGVPFVNLDIKTIKRDVLIEIPEVIAETHSLIAFDKNEKSIKVATTNPENLQIFEFIKKKTGLEVEVYITTPENIKENIKQYHQSLKAELSGNKNVANIKETDTEDVKKLKKIAGDLPVIRIVDTILEYSINQDASDIHIEPEEKNLMVRYRIDGILRDVMTLPKETQDGIAARIKIMANLKVDEHRLPQDGRFKISNDKYKISFRVSTIPTLDGEKIVMRLLNEQMQILSLEQLGLQPSSLEVVKRNIKKPNGLILATGPTGSGKTTTLYTVLGNLNTPEVNISTVEDPIEYRMNRVNQTQINHKIGLTFAIGLRALLRQDPDIIMVGEIRDEETAEIAIHAAMTGHLVLSTLHTNSAAATLPRLSDMGVPHYLIASSTNVIIAQRLVRKICPYCIQSYKLDKETIKELKKTINIDKILQTLVEKNIIIKQNKKLESLLFYKGKGCNKCNESGYKGRIGIYEALEITPEMSNLIIKQARANEIKEQADKQGMVTMIEDGFIKAKNGITTLEEVVRVTKD